MAPSIDTMPQEIVDHIVSFLPQTPLVSLPSSSSVSSLASLLSSASLVDLSCSSSSDTARETRKYFPRYAGLSRQFQAAIEPRTFQSLRVTSKNEELRAFKAILNPKRLSYIQEFRYVIALPQGKRVIFQRFKQPAEQETNNKAFTVAIRHLFRLLHTTNDTNPGMSLCIENIISPSDYFLATSLRYGRHQRSRIRLLMEPETLPLLPNVTRLTLELTEHLLRPRVLVDIASRMPNLKAINLTFDTQEILFQGIPRSDRHMLAAAIVEHMEALKNVKEVHLSLDHRGVPINQMVEMPQLLYPWRHDPLGAALRRWSGNLETLNLQGCFDGTLFWPHISESGCNNYAATLEKSKLEQLTVQLERHSPSAWWYFMPVGKDNYGIQQIEPGLRAFQYPPTRNKDLPWRNDTMAGIMAEERWDETGLDQVSPNFRLPRNVPHGKSIEPLIKSWAQALQYMPKLKQATLGFHIQTPNVASDSEDASEDTFDVNVSIEDWQIIYQAPDAEKGMWLTKLEDSDKKSRRVIFRNTRGWRPKESTMDLLLEAGKKAHEDTKIVFLAMDEYENMSRI